MLNFYCIGEFLCSISTLVQLKLIIGLIATSPSFFSVSVDNGNHVP